MNGEDTPRPRLKVGSEEFRKLGEAAGATAEELEKFTEVALALQYAEEQRRRQARRNIIYTNRAARRERARAEKRKS